MGAHAAFRYHAVRGSLRTTLTIPQTVEKTFALVSDFPNAVRWDPRTYTARKATDGSIGPGTRFVLTGGLMPKHLVKRLHLPESDAGRALPYDVVQFNAPHDFTLEGETRLSRYRDQLGFSADDDGTNLRYFAEFKMKRVGPAGEWLPQRLFVRIGDGPHLAWPQPRSAPPDTSDDRQWVAML